MGSHKWDDKEVPGAFKFSDVLFHVFSITREIIGFDLVCNV